MKKEVTGWYDKTTQPARVGVYQTSNGLDSEEFYQHWNGKFWGYAECSVDDAQYYSFEESWSRPHPKRWRGLVAQG